MLEDEMKFFDEHKAEWLERHRDRVALIRGRELFGFFDDENKAVLDGARQFGFQPFLAKRIEESEQEITAPALVLGVLSADHPIVCDRPDSDR